MRRQALQGFTLIELVMVIVLLGILSGVLAPLIVQLVENHQFTRLQADLTARGRLALDRIAREVRHAVPGTMRDVGGNAGIEFIRARAGGTYVHEADDHGAAFLKSERRFPIVAAPRSELYALGLPVGFVVNAGELLVVGNTGPGGLASSSSRLTGSVATIAATDGTDQGSVVQFDSRTFAASYAGDRFVIADQVVEIGLSGNALRWSATPIAPSGSIASYDGNADWAAGNLLIDGVGSARFTYRPGSTAAAGVLQIQLTLTENGTSVDLYQEVQVRNTP